MPNVPMILATGLGSGLAPRSPGMVGSVACFAFWCLLGLCGLLVTPYSTLVLALAVTVLGLWAVRSVLAALPPSHPENTDPQFVVIDEWAGLLLALTPVASGDLYTAAYALALFRLFDILKPGPIGWMERMPGCWGVMCDDLVAGAISGIFVHLTLILL